LLIVQSFLYNFQIKCTKIERDFKYNKFHAENHIYVIKCNNKTIEEEDKILDEIYNTLKQPETIEFLIKSIPNKCLTKTDIENLIPINMDNISI